MTTVLQSSRNGHACAYHRYAHVLVSMPMHILQYPSQKQSSCHMFMQAVWRYVGITPCTIQQFIGLRSHNRITLLKIGMPVGAETSEGDKEVLSTAARFAGCASCTCDRHSGGASLWRPIWRLSARSHCPTNCSAVLFCWAGAGESAAGVQ